ncbi:MAG TPA: hypothetical protein VJ201_06230 [Candidatus Babeliales bacterium]|nr:hypothetical protein [Candidatus Babeliales bacterium]
MRRSINLNNVIIDDYDNKLIDWTTFCKRFTQEVILSHQATLVANSCHELDPSLGIEHH